MTAEILMEGDTLRAVRKDHQEYVERTDTRNIAVIVAITDDRKLLLVEQFRVPVNQRVLELPAGKTGDKENKNETRVEGAKRELLEETGYEAKTLTEWVCGPVSAGISNENITLFYTDRIRKIQPGGGVGDEKITTHAVPLADLEEFLDGCRSNGMLIDLKIFAGLYFLENR